jgi:hypothetical protein
MLRYSCPVTGRMVETSIEVSKQNLSRLEGFKISVWCPHCQTGHKIAAQDGIIVEPVAA